MIVRRIKYKEKKRFEFIMKNSKTLNKTLFLLFFLQYIWMNSVEKFLVKIKIY